MKEIADVLQQSFLVKGLTPEQVAAIASLGQPVHFRVGEHLIHCGSCDCDLYVLVDGRVVMLTQDSDKLGEIGPAGIVGEISFVDARPHHSHAVAMSDGSAIRFPAKELRSVICSDRSSGFIVLSNLARLLAARLRAADGLVDQLSDHHHDIWQHALG